MMNKMRNSPRILAVAIVSALFINVLAQSNPYDKYRNRTYSNRGYLSEEDELKLGEQVHEELIKQARLVQDHAINEYVNSVGQRLARDSGRPNIPWRFYVVDDKSINAFATLGGRVYVHTGLLAATNSESQLASVLGHEIGHIVGRHGLENVKKSQRAGIFAGLAAIGGAILGGQAGADLGGAMGNLIGGGYLMKHSREAEREADYLGLYNLKDAGYNTGGMVEMFETLQEVSNSSPGAFGSILASHPPPGERLANTRREIDQHLRGSDHKGLSNTEDFQRLKSDFQSQSSSSPRRARPRN
ncbi:MAG TPA: M48 family metallopeptidase [Blastocatellia bacterium]|jgi:predicted Zn-dependent protease|nr:M48 family metallopeptidase [Blastocatellia bacterium]